jgi:hypothetical protein
LQIPYAIKVSVKIGERHAFKEIQVQQVQRAIKNVCQAAQTKSMESLHNLLMLWYSWYDRNFPEKLPEQEHQGTHNLFCDCRKCVPAFNTFWRELDKSIKWRKDGHLDKRYN